MQNIEVLVEYMLDALKNEGCNYNQYMCEHQFRRSEKRKRWMLVYLVGPCWSDDGPGWYFPTPGHHPLGAGDFTSTRLRNKASSAELSPFSEGWPWRSG